MRTKLLPLAVLFPVFYILLPFHLARAAATAEDLAPRCTFAASSNEDTLARLCDGSHDTAWTADEAEGQYVQLDLPEGAAAQGVYIMWNAVPEGWSLLESSGDSVWRMADLTGKQSFVNVYVPVDTQAKSVRIESDAFDWKLSIAEIRVFGPGALPEGVQVWEAPPEKADLMVVAAHPDDELIYFGGTLPYYAGQLGKRTAVIYMTSSPMIRKFEALDGLWKVGVRQYPVFLPLKNEYTSELEDAEASWDGLDNTVSLLVEQIRRFRPDVVVTHDLGGEYGHGAHKLTALAVEKAVDAGDRPDEYTESVEAYGVWQVKKCYLHLYDKNKVRMDWSSPLPAFGGRTALDMAKEGYALHVSQHFRDRPILDTGEYDNSAYGLYYSAVGPDIACDDFFENVPVIAETPAPTASAAAPPSPSPHSAAPQTTRDAETSGSAAPGASRESGIVAAVLVMLLSLAGLWAIADRRTMLAAKHAKRVK